MYLWYIDTSERYVLLYFKEPEIGRIGGGGGGPSLNGHPELAKLSQAEHENTSDFQQAT